MGAAVGDAGDRVSQQHFERADSPYRTAFVQGLKEAGFVEGQNVAIEYRLASNQYDRLPALAADLVGRQVAVFVAVGGNLSAQAAKAATSTIPIIFVIGGDPVAAGLVASLNRPGGNVTGVSWIATALTAKRLDLLHQLVPKAVLIGVLINPKGYDEDLQRRELQDAAESIRQQTLVVGTSTEADLKLPSRPLSNGGPTRSWSQSIHTSQAAAIKSSH